MHTAEQHRPLFRELALPGCYEIVFPVYLDERGMLVKTFMASALLQAGLSATIQESFYTVSSSNVLRGMHLQVPPADHVKVIYCITGRVLDVALDVRIGSPTYGEHVALELAATNAVYLERGIAHGFYVLEGPATVGYAVSSEHDRALDVGIAWDSFGMRWPTPTPSLSDRDAKLPPFNSFSSPFQYCA